MHHDCPDGVVHEWIPRTPNPKVCPRCKVYLNKTVKVKKQEEVIDLGKGSSDETGGTSENS